MPKSKKGNAKNPLQKSFGILLVLLSLFLFLNLADLKLTKYNNSQTVLKPVKNLKGEPIKIGEFIAQEDESLEPPVRILIPKQQIDLKVVEAPIINGYWETSEVNASHGKGSARPGQIGNMVIFAHAREGLFFNLKDVQLNESIYVFTNNSWKEYRVSKITSVYPNEVGVIAPTTDEQLTLYTCSGFVDEKRLIVVAKPVR